MDNKNNEDTYDENQHQGGKEGGSGAANNEQIEKVKGKGEGWEGGKGRARSGSMRMLGWIMGTRSCSAPP